MAQESKNMQDRTPKEIRCGACHEVIVPDESVKKFTDNEISRLVNAHKCQKR